MENLAPFELGDHLVTLRRRMPDLPAHPSSESHQPLRSYEEFLEDIKARIRTARARAARAINAELVEVYWQIGREILRRQAEEGPELGRRTSGVVQRLSADLRAAFPGARGYSVPSLYRMRTLAAAWPEGLSDRMRDLPWGHVVTITAKATEDARDWYAERAAAWSQEQLEAAIATRLHQREAAAITNFDRTLEAGDAAAVQRITRDPSDPGLRGADRERQGARPRGRAAERHRTVHARPRRGLLLRRTPAVAAGRRRGVHPRPALLPPPDPPLRRHRPQGRRRSGRSSPAR